MLDFLRTASTGWLAKILIGLLVVSFAVWGISGSIFYGNTNTVAQVGNTKVSTLDFRLAYENQLGALSQQFGRRLTREQADGLGLRQNVINQVVAGAVLDENASNMGLGIGEDQLAQVIASDPAFQDLSGNFSRNALAVTLRQYGISEEDYINNRKQVALRNQIQAGTAEAANLPNAFNEAFIQYRDEKRVFEYVEFGPEIIEDKPVPTPSDLTAFYEENKTLYVAPEYRKVNIISLQSADLVNLEEVSEEDVKAEYENRKSGLRAPEKRKVEQLVLDNAEQAKEVSEKLNSGASFESVVEELGKNVSDLEIGTVTATELPDEAVSSAVFAAELNKPTDVVEGIFGPVILRITEITPESTTPFEEIEGQLRNDIALRMAGDRVFEFFDAVEEERGAGELLLPTAEKLQLKSRVIEAMDSRGLDKEGNVIPDVPNLPAVAQGAFNSEPGDDTRPVEVGSDGFVWFEVDDIIPERQKPFDEVKPEVEEAWIAQELNKQVSAVAEKIVEQVEAGNTFNDALADLLPPDSFGQAVQTSKTQSLSRRDQNEGMSVRLIQAGFSVAADQIVSTEVDSGKYAVVKVSGIEKPVSSTLEEAEINGINEAASQDVLSQLVQDLQSRESVSINQNAIEAAFNPYGGGHNGM